MSNFFIESEYELDLLKNLRLRRELDIVSQKGELAWMESELKQINEAIEHLENKESV